MLHGVVEQVYSFGKLWADFLVGDGTESDPGCLYALAVGRGEGAGGGLTDVTCPSPAGLVWARGGADRARAQLVESVAAGLDSSVMPALEEVLFDQICRRNGIVHRLTAPRSPTTTGKVERFQLLGPLLLHLLSGPLMSHAGGPEQPDLDQVCAGLAEMFLSAVSPLDSTQRT